METSNLVHIDRVRCLECGAKYVKPTDGGTVSRNPGCPRCGYLGWILATIPSRAADADAPLPTDADRRLRLHAQLR